MFDLKTDTEERFRVRSNILQDPQHVYITCITQQVYILQEKKPIASTIKQTQENLITVWNRVGIFEEEKVRLLTEELNKLRRAKNERNCTANLVQKASIDKMEEEK